MALPTLSSHWPSRRRPLERQLVRQREQEAQRLQQWQMHSQYFKEQQVRSSKQAQWSSRESFQQSMSVFWREHQQEERRKSLEERRERLRKMLKEENARLESELRASARERSAFLRQQQERSKDQSSSRIECWKKVESETHKDCVVSQGEVQQQRQHKKQAEEEAAEERQRFENEYARNRQEVLERMKEEERKKDEQGERDEFLSRQMEELKLQDEQWRRLQQDEDVLLSQCLELEQFKEDRKHAEESRKKSEFGCFLGRQYRAQLKRRAQQVQEELEADWKILVELMEEEEEDRQLEIARRERTVADVAWMKRVLEEQLLVEREREAEFDLLHRETAQRVWDHREAQWEKERKARERLMHEVLSVHQEQLQERMGAKRGAREECERRRAELLEQLRVEEEEKRWQREEQEQHCTEHMHDISVQVERRHREQWDEQQRLEQEEEGLREGLRLQQEELHLENERMTRRICSRPRSAWT